jgi:hypothetical protein
MSQALTIVSDASTLPAALGPDLAAAIDLAKAEKAVSTRKAYATDFRIFKDWCDARGVPSLPAAPETVASYLAAHAGTSKASTLGRRVAAIRYAHKLAGLPLPTDAEGVKATMRGIRRTYGSARIRKAPAVDGRHGAGRLLRAAGSRVALDWLRGRVSPFGARRAGCCRYPGNRNRPVSDHPGEQDRSGTPRRHYRHCSR